jgi:hypothetical protein
MKRAKFIYERAVTHCVAGLREARRDGAIDREELRARYKRSKMSTWNSPDVSEGTNKR